jgi:hypothetical protein
MRLSDAGARRHPTKLIYPDHRSPPSLNEDATRNRSNRLLDVRRHAHSTGGFTRKFCTRARSEVQFKIPINIRHKMPAATPKRIALWHTPEAEVTYVQLSASSITKTLVKQAGIATTTVRTSETQTNVMRRPRDQLVKALGGGPRSISGCALQ